MTTPAAISGAIVEPSYATQGVSNPAHNFFNVLRDLIYRTQVYHSEAAKHAALDAIDAYEKQVVPQGDQSHVISEDERAPREDVTKRRPPSAAPPTVPSGPIDYAQLAAAIVAAQQAQSGPVVPEDEEDKPPAKPAAQPAAKPAGQAKK